MAKVNRESITTVTLYTGSKGRESCICKCPNCSQRTRDEQYQGTLEQAEEMFELLPNLKEVYTFGNPDVAVDTEFCNKLFHMAIERNIKVSACTSGVGGKRTLEKLFDGISPENVKRLSFSFDSDSETGMSVYKGIKYPFETAVEGLCFAISEGYNVRVQPTIWSSNSQNVKKLMEFFIELGVTCFRFHIGSIEHGVHSPNHKHITKEELTNVLNQIDEVVSNNPYLKVRCPSFFNLGDSDQYHHCQNPSKANELLLFFEKEGIRATNVPIVSEFRSDVSWILGHEIDIPEIKVVNGICPYSKKLTGGIETQCRYQSRYWNW